jgi:hypothetical protein
MVSGEARMSDTICSWVKFSTTLCHFLERRYFKIVNYFFVDKAVLGDRHYMCNWLAQISSF